MKIFIPLLLVIGLGACAAETPPAETTAAEAPFYTVYPNGTGPLTMAELQINIPREIDEKLTDKRRVCHMEAIEKFAAEAGDPETLNPADVSFLPTDGSWDNLTRSGKRGLLAQAVVSRAFTVC